MNGKLFVFVLLWLCADFISVPEAFAQGNCPPGYFPIGGGSAGWQGCAPMGPAQGDGGNQSSQPALKPRWGAIAITNGAFGVSADADSQADAERKALSDCQSMSNGRPCVVRMAHENQCLALAWGAKGNAVAHAPMLEEAEQLAMVHCNSKGAACEIYYSGCSVPTRN
jgi:hypothetical protein